MPRRAPLVRRSHLRTSTDPAPVVPGPSRTVLTPRSPRQHTPSRILGAFEPAEADGRDRQRTVVQERGDVLDPLPGLATQPIWGRAKHIQARRREAGQCEVPPEAAIDRGPDDPCPCRARLSQGPGGRCGIDREAGMVHSRSAGRLESGTSQPTDDRLPCGTCRGDCLRRPQPTPSSDGATHGAGKYPPTDPCARGTRAGSSRR